MGKRVSGGMGLVGMVSRSAGATSILDSVGLGRGSLARTLCNSFGSNPGLGNLESRCRSHVGFGLRLWNVCCRFNSRRFPWMAVPRPAVGWRRIAPRRNVVPGHDVPGDRGEFGLLPRRAPMAENGRDFGSTVIGKKLSREVSCCGQSWLRIGPARAASK